MPRASAAWAAACSYLASNVVRSLEVPTGEGGESTSCTTGLESTTNTAAMGLLRSEAKQVDVGSLRIEGDLAFVIYRGPGDIPYAIPMAQEGGSWKVAALAGGPLG